MSVVVAILGLVVVLLVLFVLALLRSHAEILRRLAALESTIDGAPAPVAMGAGRGAAMDPSTARGRAADISGQSPGGDGVKLSLRAGAPPTLLAFMGSGCHSCERLWAGLADGPVPTPAGARLVVITKGAERERLARLLELAPAGVEVVMSSEAYDHYAVPSTPHFVLVQSGQITGRGAATSWQQITEFLTDAADDDRIHRARTLGTDDRAARAEAALNDAGIGPGHASLYPSHAGTREPSID